MYRPFNAVIHIWDHCRSHVQQKHVIIESHEKLSSQTIQVTRYETTKSHNLQI